MVVFFYTVIGLIIGSFLNVVVIRKGALALSGRSVCLSCSTQIRWYDNVPVLSWFVLRGRCRDCGSRISMQYPIVEAVTGIVFGLLAYGLTQGLPNVLQTLSIITILPQAILAALLLAIAVYDARHTIIPDAWVYAFDVLAFVLGIWMHPTLWYLFVLAGITTALPLFTLWVISRGAWMGLGDVKLAIGMGFFLGPLFGIVAVFLAFIIGAVVSLLVLLPLPYYVALYKRGIAGLGHTRAHFTMKSEVPFGPFLVAAFFALWLAILFNIPLPL